jgi:pyruvate/2-oxoglutarate/acetoin dehydrogenase E1 component
MEMTGQTPGFAGQHSDYEIDSTYMHIPGVRTVVPSTPYDAKGMMHAALRSPDPVVYLYPAGLRMLSEEVPDEAYEVPLDKAAVRQEGTDLTIVGSGAGMPVWRCWPSCAVKALPGSWCSFLPKMACLTTGRPCLKRPCWRGQTWHR